MNSITLDHARGEKILLEAAALADAGEFDRKWAERVEALSEACEGKARSHIAFLGIAMLAKATDLRVNVYAIKASANVRGSYSVRSFGHAVLVPNTSKLGINIGATGREPMNNQPYFRSEVVSAKMIVHKRSQVAVEVLLRILKPLSEIKSKAEALRALAAYVAVRRDYVPAYAEYATPSAAATATQLCRAVRDFVGADSEGGKRAQAAVAGLIDATFGDSSRVIVPRINDPDRRAPGDVSVRSADGEAWDLALEVRDKSVKESDLRIFAEKAAKAQAARAGVVAISGNQQPVFASGVQEWAAARGMAFLLFLGWDALINSIIFWQSGDTAAFVSVAQERIHARLVAIEASPKTVDEWVAAQESV